MKAAIAVSFRVEKKMEPGFEAKNFYRKWCTGEIVSVRRVGGREKGSRVIRNFLSKASTNVELVMRIKSNSAQEVFLRKNNGKTLVLCISYLFVQPLNSIIREY
jgi:hypothetical protein